MSIAALERSTFNYLNIPGCGYYSLTNKIRYITNEFCWFYELPNIGLDGFMISDGKPLGTSGLTTCFAICSIGKTVHKASVLGLCHLNIVASGEFADVLQKLKKEMVDRGAARETIETYVIGGEAPSSEEHPGTIEFEKEMLDLAAQENIQGVLFNAAQAKGPLDEEVLSVVLTPENVFVSKNLLFQSAEETADFDIESEPESPIDHRDCDDRRL